MHQSKLNNVIFGGADATARERRAHHAYLAVVLLAFALLTGILSLRLTAFSYASLDGEALYASYFRHPLIVVLNLLPPVLLTALGYFLTRRAWAAYLICAVPTIGFSLVNYYKIQLRGDPFLAADFRLARTAGGILGHYTLDVSDVVITAAAASAAMLLFAVFLLPNGVRGKKLRLGGTLVSLALMALLYPTAYLGTPVYEATINDDALQNSWSDVEIFVSRGFYLPFIRSIPKAFPAAPEGYSARGAQALLAQYPEGDIPREKQVNVVGVMLEAFCDLSDYPMLARQKSVADTYAPLHKLEEKSVSGDLLTNIFAGGTVDSEWGFLTGYSHHSEFRGDVDSYVRYFKSQGYDTLYSHPGYSWFYNRRNINGYLGFDESFFTEDGFGELVDPEIAPYRSDEQLFDYLLRELRARSDADAPLFSFSVSYQNHGPYGDELFDGAAIPAGTEGWSAESCGILSHYLYGVSDTIAQAVRFTAELEQLEQPVVLVLYGDHKPWLGNDKAVYLELGVNIDYETEEGLYNFYSTPYLIWANSAAKQVLGNDFTGDGGDFSPCFLMAKLFDECSWDGPAFMALARGIRSYTPLVHDRGLYLENGALTDELSPEVQEFYMQYRRAEFYREHHGLSGGGSMQHKNGFTLAELLIVVAILAVLVAIAVPLLHNQTEKANRAADMSTMRAAYSAMVVKHLDGDVQTGKRYFFDPAGSTFSETTKPAKGYGKSKTNAKIWWTGVGTAVGIPNSNGTPAVLQMIMDENGAVSFYWGGGAYTGLNVTGADEYKSLTYQQRLERDEILLNGIQSELQGMTYGQLHDLFFDGNTLKAEFAEKAVTGTTPQDRAVDDTGIGGMCVTIAESTIEGDTITIDGEKHNQILTPSLFTAAGYDISEDNSKNYLVTSVSGRTNARIWACLGISMNELQNLSADSEKWNQTADKAYAYIKGAGAKTPSSISQTGRKPK